MVGPRRSTSTDGHEWTWIFNILPLWFTTNLLVIIENIISLEVIEQKIQIARAFCQKSAAKMNVDR